MTTDAHPITRVLAAFDVPLGDVKPLTGNARVHWGERARVTKALRELGYYHAMAARRSIARPQKHQPVGGPRRVNLTLWHGKGDRTLDDDNLIAALKPVRDGALVKTGLIVDDSPRWATFTYHQDRAKDGRRRVAVTVYSVAE